MNATQQSDGSWSVLSDSGNTYSVTSSSCSCPHFRLRLKGKGDCKHITYIKTLVTTAVEVLINKSLIEFIKTTGVTKHSDIITVFGNNVDTDLQQLINRGEIVYNPRNDSYQVM